MAGSGAVLVEAPSLLERAVAYTRTSLGLVTPGALTAPTPCSGWDLRTLLTHMDDSLAAITEAADIGYVAPRPCNGVPPEVALVGALKARACALLGAWSVEPLRREVLVAGRPVPATLLAAAGALEIAVHGWDVARACGVDRPLPEPLARDLLEAAPLVVDDADRPARFAAPLDVVGVATQSERLLAFLGRSSGGQPASAT